MQPVPISNLDSPVHILRRKKRPGTEFEIPFMLDKEPRHVISTAWSLKDFQ